MALLMHSLPPPDRRQMATASPEETAAAVVGDDAVVDGCYCELDTLAKVNHDHLKPLLSQLVNQTFFKFFKLNLYQVPPPPSVLASIAALFLIPHTTRHTHTHTHTILHTRLHRNVRFGCRRCCAACRAAAMCASVMRTKSRCPGRCRRRTRSPRSAPTNSPSGGKRRTAKKQRYAYPPLPLISVESAY